MGTICDSLNTTQMTNAFNATNIGGPAGETLRGTDNY